MSSLANKMKVMQLLGTGLSVHTLLDRAGLTMGQLCELADEYPDLHTELKRWYKRYDFGLLKEGRDFKKVETPAYSDVAIKFPDPKSLETNEKIAKATKRGRKKVVEK